MGPLEEDPGLLRILVDRCSELEASHASLRAELDEMTQSSELTRREKVEVTSSSSSSSSGGLKFPGNFRTGNPYSHVLDSMCHSIHVTRASSSGEIIYWNRAAEKLYGWKDYEVLGQCYWEFLIEEDYAPSVNKIMEKMRFGQSWSGQFPFKKRSGEMFMALVTKSPLYEDGELVGVITVSSDAAVFNSVNSNEPRVPGFNMKRIQWHSRPQIASVPQMASSISNLASKVLSRRRSEDVSREEEGSISESENVNQVRQDTDMAKGRGEGKNQQKEESAIAQPAKFAAKLFAKLQKKSTSKNAEASDGNGSLMQNGLLRKANCEPYSPRGPKETTSDNIIFDARSSPFAGALVPVNEMRMSYALEKAPPCESLSKEFHECFKEPKLPTYLSASSLHVDYKDAEPGLENPKAGEVDDAGEQVGARNTSSGESRASSNDSPSVKGDTDSISKSDSDIRWEDLQLGEEVGQGAFAVVYHGLWNGSDVAIKVYFGKDYSEGTLLYYKKEIGIMRRLRHPNVLLFMGACYSQERLAIVTEYLPRGSLFKLLHRSNQALDYKRRLKMALDVARGMNYLHRRNPPIVHRDLKSSNLLVDKNWNVKVGDFGLSKLKHATFLTAKSGAGTPQWMAPEVLRNERSNEKSDVFSFGVILWELVTVSIPWGNLNSLQVVGVVGFMDRRLDMPEGLDPRISSMITECWQSKPELRPSFGEIIQRMTAILQGASSATASPVIKSLPS